MQFEWPSASMLVVRLLLRGRNRCCEVGDQGIDNNKTRILLPYLQQQIVVIPAIATAARLATTSCSQCGRVCSIKLLLFHSCSDETTVVKLLTLLPYLQQYVVDTCHSCNNETVISCSHCCHICTLGRGIRVGIRVGAWLRVRVAQRQAHTTATTVATNR